MENQALLNIFLHASMLIILLSTHFSFKTAKISSQRHLQATGQPLSRKGHHYLWTMPSFKLNRTTTLFKRPYVYVYKHVSPSLFPSTIRFLYGLHKNLIPRCLGNNTKFHIFLLKFIKEKTLECFFLLIIG